MDSDGTRRGDSLLLLSNKREIARDNLWAIRAIPTVLTLGIVFAHFTDPYPSGGAGDVVLGAVIIFLPLYWIALRLSSSRIEEDGERGG